ncbi:MAG: lipopolysaccharide heptosyltransferase I [Gammaproteobacteria bacterium]
MRIALIRLTSLGDIILCMASLQIIKRHLPACTITWIADSKFADILDYHPDLQHIVKLDLKGTKKHFSLAKAWSELQKITNHGDFDLAIDLHGMLKSAIITRITAKKCSGFVAKQLKEPLAGWLYKTRYHISFDIPVVARYVTLAAKSLGFSFLEEELIEKHSYLYYSDKDRSFTKEYFNQEKKNIILIPETSMPYKNYPKDKYANIANLLGENILITSGNAAERTTAEYIAEKSSFITLLPPLNLNQLKAAISQADLVIGGDTGPSHIAWANNIPSITLFGATSSNCSYATKINKIITSQRRTVARRIDKADFSIRDIPERIVLKAAEQLLT